MPYILFKSVIVPQCKEGNIFSTRYNSIPAEFKVLVALRCLGRDAVCDDCEELSNISEKTCNVILKQFIKEYPKKFGHLYIKMSTGDELLNDMEVYRCLGFPGAIGSADCTHIKLDKC